jgi:hypothetical protein
MGILWAVFFFFFFFFLFLFLFLSLTCFEVSITTPMGEDSFCPFLSPNWHPSQLDKRPLPENPKKIHMILTTEPLAFPFAPTGAQASLISGPYQKILKKSI